MDSAAFVVIIFLLPSVLAAYLYYLFAGIPPKFFDIIQFNTELQQY